MIEIVLALGLVAVGLVSIMALFPVGMNATRDGMAEEYAATAADQVLHHFGYLVGADLVDNASGNPPPDGVLDWDLYMQNGGTKEISAAVPTLADRADFDPLNTTISQQVANSNGTLYRNTNNATSGWRQYKVLRYVERGGLHADEFDPNTNDLLDFEAIMVVWRSQITLPTSPITLINYDYGAKLNVEISWPARLPYAIRQSSYFCLELFNR